MARDALLFRLGGAATVVALCVVVLGAWVRLSDAGLGCPDWPGCYGHVDVPAGAGERAAAQAAYPERPLEPAKAWKEMVHRYAAGALGLLVAALAAVAVARRRRGVAPGLPVALLALVIFQALLGMWTVTLLLKPIIVLAHLLGGLALLAGLTWLTLCHAPRVPNLVHPPWLRGWVLVCAGVLVLQIMLGGWTSTNYAALACPDFPTCQGEWWPETDFANAFVPWRGLGIDYAGGVLRAGPGAHRHPHEPPLGGGRGHRRARRPGAGLPLAGAGAPGPVRRCRRARAARPPARPRYRQHRMAASPGAGHGP
jgi:cytochrome c oxidase assembly protein subunit 15